MCALWHQSYWDFLWRFKKNNLEKSGRRPRWIFFFFHTKKYTDGQQAHGKMFNITPYWGDAHQNHSEISPHIWQNGYPTKYYRQQVKMWRKGNPCALLMGTSIGTTAMENYTEVLKQNTILWSTAEHFSKENKNMKKRGLVMDVATSHSPIFSKAITICWALGETQKCWTPAPEVRRNDHNDPVLP